MDPADSNPLADVESCCSRAELVYPPHHLVTRHDRQPRRRGATLDLVELRVADTAGADFDPNLSGFRLGNRKLHCGKGCLLIRSPFKVSLKASFHPFSNLAVDTWGCLEF